MPNPVLVHRLIIFASVVTVTLLALFFVPSPGAWGTPEALKPRDAVLPIMIHRSLLGSYSVSMGAPSEQDSTIFSWPALKSHLERGSTCWLGCTDSLSLHVTVQNEEYRVEQDKNIGSFSILHSSDKTVTIVLRGVPEGHYDVRLSLTQNGNEQAHEDASFDRINT